MVCRDVDSALIETRTPLSPPIEAHVSQCRRCQTFVRALGESYPEEHPSASGLVDIERRIAIDLRPVLPLNPAHLVATLAGISVFAVSVSAWKLGALGLSAIGLVQGVVVLGVLGASAVFLADSLVRQMAPGSRHRVQPELLPGFLILLFTVMVAVLFHFRGERHFWQNGWACFQVGALIGLVTAAPFWLVMRRGAILSPPAAGAAVGLLAGLVGAAVLEIRCPNLDAWHVLVSHFGVAAVGALVGLLAASTLSIARSARGLA